MLIRIFISVVFYLWFAISQAQAFINKNPWELVTIPNAKCGNGEDYTLFIRKGHSQKIAFGFSEGGACWSEATCFGMGKRTNLKPVKSMNREEGIFSRDSRVSVLADFTQVYFTYCNGDVYVGTHKAQYGDNKVFHVGRRNVEQSVQYLVDQNIVDLSSASKIVLYGFSAGAIGALFHAQTLDRYVDSQTVKTIISDSPGMHFGNRFWKKWPDQFINDFANIFKESGLELDSNDGFVAKQIRNYCDHFSDWNIGVLQSTRDIVMSLGFGDISPFAHRELVLSEDGILKQTQDPNDNCSAWVPDSFAHTFLRDDDGAGREVGQKSAINYTNDLVRLGSGQNYPLNADDYISYEQKIMAAQ